MHVGSPKALAGHGRFKFAGPGWRGPGQQTSRIGLLAYAAAAAPT